MRFAALGDLHITDKKPKGRMDDDYLASCIGKVDYVLDCAANNGCDIILQPGDLTEQRDESYTTCASIAALFSRYSGMGVYGVLGQHDTPFHNVYSPNTVHSILRSAGLMTLLGKVPMVMEGVAVYGASWGEPIPIPSKDFHYNILVMHRMVINGKLWAGQEDYIESHVLLREHKFDFIITGDNHTGFDVSLGTRRLVNCGSMMRSNVGQKDHVPHFWIFDTDEGTCERFIIPVKRASAVLSYEEHEEKKADDQRFNAFISQLSGTNAVVLDFKENIKRKMVAAKVDKPVADIVKECVI